MVKTTKGGKTMNPTDAYRKELRKKELKRNKKERKKVREVGILKKDPETLREQIQKLEAMKADGALDKARKHKKRQLEDTLNLVLKKRKEYEDKMKEKGEAPVMFSHLGPVQRRATAEEEERVKHPRPEDSVYYHPTLNPSGAPPPGKPPMFKSSIGPRIPLPDESASNVASSSKTETDDGTLSVPPLPPPLPGAGLDSGHGSVVPASLPLPPPPPMPPKPAITDITASLPPPPPPPGPLPKELLAVRPPLPPPPPIPQSAQPLPPGTAGSEKPTKSNDSTSRDPIQGFLGLSGAILIQVYQTFFKNKPSSYLLLLALLPTINSLVLMGFVRIFKTNEEDEKKHLNGFSFLAIILAAYLTAVIIIQNILKLKLSVRVFTFVLLVLLLVSPIFVAVKAHRDKSYRILKSLLEHNQISDERGQLDEDVTNIREDHGEYHEVSNGADQVMERNDDTLQWREDLNLLQAMGTISFWFLFFTTACAMGSGLATVNNMSQIGESLGYTSLEINTLVSLWSIWNFLGRFGAGYISDYFLHVKGCPRPLFIVISLAAMSIGHTMIASGFPGALYAGSILVGVCYGSQWSLMPTIASEIFGKVHLGTIFNTITIAGPIGSYILSVRVVGYIYDKEVSEYGKTCIGTRCFMLAFFIMAFVTFSGFLVALGLLFRTRNFYKHVILQRLLHSLRQSRLTIDVK